MERLTNLLKIEYLVSGILSLNTKTRDSYLGFFPVYQVKAQEISEHHQLSLRCHEHGVYMQPRGSRFDLTRDCVLTPEALTCDECSTSREEKEWGGSTFQEGPHFLSVALDTPQEALVSQVLLKDPE